MADSGMQDLISRILVDRRYQQEFLANPFPVLEHYDLTSRDVRDLIFWLPLRLPLSGEADNDSRPVLFADRADAGRQLAALLARYQEEATVVMAIPRGGVVVGYEVAQALEVPLGILPARKLGCPWNPEFAFGAIAPGSIRVLDDRAARLLGLSQEEIDRITTSEQAELERRERRFAVGLPRSRVSGKTVILVDDGVATSGTARAAIRSLRQQKPKAIVFAVPICQSSAAPSLQAEVDDFVCVAVPSEPRAVGYWYDDYSQVTDAEVAMLLEAVRDGDAARTPEIEVEIPVRDAVLKGVFALLPQARGIVLFAHGSGSGRRSPRNRYMASQLQRAGLATLLIDLLTPEEEAIDQRTRKLRFDVDLLAGRLLAVTDWLSEDPRARGLPIGYFGASTGAAAALVAAARRPLLAAAIVSRGGRPDLAASSLADVCASTLLIVGGNDTDVLELNREVLELLTHEKRLEIVRGAGHLFEEPGALERVADLSTEWFSRFLGISALPGKETGSPMHQVDQEIQLGARK